jgi:hypothetical protein
MKNAHNTLAVVAVNRRRRAVAAGATALAAIWA